MLQLARCSWQHNAACMPNIGMLLQEGLRQPVIAADGHTYERIAIEEWLLQHDGSPVTGLAFSHSCLIPNLSIGSLISGNLESA